MFFKYLQKSTKLVQAETVVLPLMQTD